MELDKKRIGLAVCGSFCTFEKALAAAKRIRLAGAELTPIMSFNAAAIDSRFGIAAENIRRFEDVCGKKAILTIEGAEPIGPKRLFDIVAVAPCTGNTLAKLALGITDSPVTMAVKSHRRNGGPVVIAVSTNDALSASAKNIGALMGCRGFYFVPMTQDDSENKPFSVVADYSLLPDTISTALDGRQLQPILLNSCR